MPKKRKVLISAPYFQQVFERFKSIFDENNIEVVLPQVEERLEEKELLRYIPEIDGVICGDDAFTEKVLRSASRLKIISKWGTGIDSIDQKVCKELGIAVRNTPNAFTDPVADSVLGYILSFARNIPWMDKQMKQSIWCKISSFSLSEKVLGVIGVGNIGKAVTMRAISFGMRILGNDIKSVPKNFIQETGIEMVEKKELYKKSDFISLNCDLNPTTRNLINMSVFNMMKKSAFIINTARGRIIKENDMIKALEDRIIAGAALDVFEREPLSADSPLLKMDNLLLAPHNSNSSPKAWEKVHNNTIRNLLEELKG